MLVEVIANFVDEETRRVYETGKSRRFGNIARVAARRLGDLSFAVSLDDLRNPPGNRLEKLKGDRAGQFSLRINDQYRVCFRWVGDSAYDVEIVDYH
jgi:proteic killer suppression protein